MNSEQLFSSGVIISCTRDALASGYMIKARGGASMVHSIPKFPQKVTAGIYAIIHRESGNLYIGSSWNIERRWNKHISLLEGNKHHSPHLQRAWNKYGSNSFDFVVWYRCSRADLLIHEQRYLDELKPAYNVCATAGSKKGTPRSEETKAKLRAANLGKKQSEETKRKRSEALKGIVRSDEFRKKQSACRIGKPGNPHTKESRAKISAALKGKPLNEKNKRGISKAMKGNQNTLGKHWTWKKNANQE